MICDNCGMSVGEAAKFCSGCGLSIAIGSTGGQLGGIDKMASPSPVSALFMDPPPSQSSLPVTCVIHFASVAAAACVGCGNFYCRDCLIRYEDRNYCRNCAARLSSPQPQNVTTYQYHQAGRSLTIPPEPQPSYHPQQVPYHYQMQANAYARPPMPYVKRKEPVVAFLLSFFLPGAGQIYNGDVGKGIALMIGFFLLVWIGIGLVFWLWAIIDAYQSATNINLGRRV